MSAWRVGCSTYIWQQKLDLHANLEKVCAEIAGAGFEGLEAFYKYVQTQAEEDAMREALQDAQLDLAALYVGGDFHDRAKHPEALARAENVARRLFELCESDWALIWGPTPIKGRAKVDAELAHEAEACVRIGELLHELGCGPLCIHNHVPELLEDAKELEALCRATDPAQVGLNVDLEWCVQAGFDPVAVLRRFGPRVKHLHLRNSANKVWSDQLGEGELDYPRIAETLREIDYRGWLILEDAWDGKRELKLSFKERAEKGREAIRRWFGV